MTREEVQKLYKLSLLQKIYTLEDDPPYSGAVPTAFLRDSGVWHLYYPTQFGEYSPIAPPWLINGPTPTPEEIESMGFTITA